MSRISLLTLAALTSLASPALVVAGPAAPVQVITVQAAGTAQAESSLDAVVEAVRQTTLSSQVAGAVVALHVKAGDRVKAGQELLRIDARAAQHNAAGSSAQVEAAQANLAVATKELERQQQLLQKQYISQGAFDRAQSQWDAAKAQVKALQAQTQAAQTQSGFFVVNAPYAGVVSDVPVTVGDMAMPGRALVTLHDPSALRVTAAVPQALLAAVAAQPKAIRYELPGVAGYTTPQAPQQVQVLPAVDPVTHTGQIRLSLPAGVEGLAPGMFARVWLPGASTGKASVERMFLPSTAIVRRAEMTGVVVINNQGQPSLRQVRLGQTVGERVEILSGLRMDDKVAAEPALAGAAR
ncbi:MAG: efflux RND transporter periplasmic adaptor subunit [Pseudomonadota bacterium]|jgi:RND family efflux transporter MFP subunit